MGGRNIAEWKGDQIHFNYTGGKSAQTVQHAIKCEAAPADLEGYEKNPPTVENPPSLHTPGPWKVHESGYTVEGGPGYMTSVAQTYPAIGEETAKANARLIAAAPEMMETLRSNAIDLNNLDGQIFRFIGENIPEHSTGFQNTVRANILLWEENVRDIVLSARKVVDKAQGVKTNPPTSENPPDILNGLEEATARDQPNPSTDNIPTKENFRKETIDEGMGWWKRNVEGTKTIPIRDPSIVVVQDKDVYFRRDVRLGELIEKHTGMNLHSSEFAESGSGTLLFYVQDKAGGPLQYGSIQPAVDGAFIRLEPPAVPRKPKGAN